MNMRKVSTVLLLALASVFAFGQNLPIDEKTNLVTYTKVVTANNMSAKELFDLGKEFCEKKGYTIKEEVSGQKFEFNASFPVYYPSVNSGKNDEGKISFLFYMDFKDGKYRYILNEFVHTGVSLKNSDGGPLENKSAECGGQKMTGRGWVTVKNKTDAKIKELASELEQLIKEVENDPKKNSDW